MVGAGIPCALVTMSFGSLADQVVEQSGNVFSAVVTGDQVSKGKPDPEAYLLAAKRLGVDPSQCVAIEDSPVGIRSAHSSGAATIAVPRHRRTLAFQESRCWRRWKAYPYEISRAFCANTPQR